MTSAARLLASLEHAGAAVRFGLVGDLGRIRREKRAKGWAYYIDFRPYGRVWSHRGIRLADEATSRRVLEQIRGKVADGRALEEVLAEYLPVQAKPNLVRTRLERWLEVRRRETAAGSLSPRYLTELERLAGAEGYFAFFDDFSIHEISYGTLEDFSLWLGDRGLSPKSRRNYLAAFQAFLKWLYRRGDIARMPEVPLPKADEHQPHILSIGAQDRVLAEIPEPERGVFLAMAHLGLRPGEARALQVADYHDGWLSVDKAVKGKSVGAPVRGTKSGKAKRLPASEALQRWLAAYVDPRDRLRQRPLFPNPRTGRMWAHKSLQRVWREAVEAASLPPISLYEGTKHSMATDAIRRGVSERHLQRFLGHASVESTRRYARLADNAMLEVLRPSEGDHRQATDKDSATEAEKSRDVAGGPSWIRTRDHPVMSRLL